ncbi:cation-translocating P-type ATPase [Confluentibacter lentus]|uniref:cation-translocating P-type ATPase n=1 Tax=Confluentibacter lentus TaxID=1699412 RepID=UPI0018E267EE|nr:cation-translocating P-type ATPase [Confluentibacter lentus]
MISVENFNIKGLSSNEVLKSRKQFGGNSTNFKRENELVRALKSLLKEPMVILLLVTASIYFITGNVGDGVFLSVAIVLVSTISLYQDSKSRNALEKLKDLTKPHSKVIRNGEVVDIKSEDIVIGDALIVEEGYSIAADGTIIHSNDFSVNESLLTGESLAVYKDKDKAEHFVYQGTTVASGLAIATVSAIGEKTELGKIGKSLESIEEEKTPIEIQIQNFIKKMVVAGVVIFIGVWVLNYFRTYDILDSLLKSLTLAMSILPEEIPIAFTTFMALGTYRLLKMGIVVKQMKTVETLGSATTICVDKTGTITKNDMSLVKIYSLKSNSISDADSSAFTADEKELIALAMWASEPIPFDAMEMALHDAYSKTVYEDERPKYKMVHEYPLGGTPPMMTHIFENDNGKRIIAAKGAPEAIMNVSELSENEKKQINDNIKSLASNGYRLLAVGISDFSGNDFPSNQQDFKFNFKGIVAFYDPPKSNIQSVFKAFYDAGIKVKIITGDNENTALAIAKQIHFKHDDKHISGSELMNLSEIELQSASTDNYLFTRMFPDAKLKIVNALKAQNEIIAMTGDGINDAPALKSAHIGIAMGKRGTEIAKQAASIILVEDDLSKMIDAIAMGRKIYANLKKAIQYIISIHIPIILTVFIPLALGWVYPNIFSPVHVILLELIMGPTCSIIYENEPMEKNIMQQKPRPFTHTFLNFKELTTSIFQGLMITGGILLIYQYAVYSDYGESLTRTMVFLTLIVSNMTLTLVNRSFFYSVITTLGYKNKLVPLIIGITIFITTLFIFVEPFIGFLKFERLSMTQVFLSFVTGFLFVIWYEILKWYKRKQPASIVASH